MILTWRTPSQCTSTMKNRKTYVRGDMSKWENVNMMLIPIQRQPAYGQKFSVRTDWYLCGKCVDKNKAKRFPNNTGYEFSTVMTMSIIQTVAKMCDERRKLDPADEWAHKVSHRRGCINDLPTEEAIYHRRCSQYFMSPRNYSLDAISATGDGTPPKKRGRPSGSVDETKKSAFKCVIDYLENNNDETVTLDELFKIMQNQGRQVLTVCIVRNHCIASCTHTMVT